MKTFIQILCFFLIITQSSLTQTKDSILSINLTINHPDSSNSEVQIQGRNDDQARPGLGFEIRENEITFSFYNENKIGIYRPIYKVNIAFLNSEGETLISSSALYSLGYLIIAAITAGAIHGKDLNKNHIYLYSIPLLLTNAEHHLTLIEPQYPESLNGIGLSLFANFKTDVFDSMGVIYSPGAGIQTEYNWGDVESYLRYCIVLQAGVEIPYEFKLKQFQEARMFLGLKISIDDIRF